MRTLSVYIAAGPSRVISAGVTNDLERRIAEHRRKRSRGFTALYNVTRLVYFEQHERAADAIAREKQLKGWVRARKIALIEKDNPTWRESRQRMITTRRRSTSQGQSRQS